MVIFEKKELHEFNLDELKKMLNIQIKYEKFEGAASIRDEIEYRKKGFGISNSDNDDDETELL